MRLTDSHGIDWIREPNGSWRLAQPDELSSQDDPEGYMHGWFHGLMCGLTIALLLLVALAWIASYTKFCQ